MARKWILKKILRFSRQVCRLVSALVFISLFFESREICSDDFDIQSTDKQAHIAVSYGLALTSTLVLEKHEASLWKAVLYGTLFSLSTGLAKEYLIDKSPSAGDIIADGIGNAMSAGVVFTFEL